jgi:hypothetical protein
MLLRFKGLDDYKSLPDHMHLADEFVTACMPKDPVDEKLVRDFMVHHCTSRCTGKNGSHKCCYGYTQPDGQPLCTVTVADEAGFPIYKRDHHFMVPTNLLLLRLMQTHVNVLYSASATSIAYLFKYISKGSEYTPGKIFQENNEILAFCNVCLSCILFFTVCNVRLFVYVCVYVYVCF